MIRQRSLCTIKPTERDRPPLSRNNSLKVIKPRLTRSRQASPPASATRQAQREKEKDKKQRCDSRGEKQCKVEKAKQEERKTSARTSPINIKKDLKYLITKNTTCKKQKAGLELKGAKSKASKGDQRTVTKREDPLPKKNSICNLKVIKEEKYSRPKLKKPSENKPSRQKSKETSLGPHRERSTNKKSELTSVGWPLISHEDSGQFKSYSRDLCSELTSRKEEGGAKQPHQKQTFLEFFKQYRNSFDLRGARNENERSKLKSGRVVTEIEAIQKFSGKMNGREHKA